MSVSSILQLAVEDKKWLTGGDDQFISMRLLCFLPIMGLSKAASSNLEMSIVLLQTTHIALVFDEGSAAIQALTFSSAFHFPLKHISPLSQRKRKAYKNSIENTAGP